MNGTDVKDMRVSMGLTQSQLAEMVGVAPFTVRRWESGKVKPSPLAIARIREVVRTIHDMSISEPLAEYESKTEVSLP